MMVSEITSLTELHKALEEKRKGGNQPYKKKKKKNNYAKLIGAVENGDLLKVNDLLNKGVKSEDNLKLALDAALDNDFMYIACLLTDKGKADFGQKAAIKEIGKWGALALSFGWSGVLAGPGITVFFTSAASLTSLIPVAMSSIEWYKAGTKENDYNDKTSKLDKKILDAVKKIDELTDDRNLKEEEIADKNLRVGKSYTTTEKLTKKLGTAVVEDNVSTTVSTHEESFLKENSLMGAAAVEDDVAATASTPEESSLKEDSLNL